MYTLNGKNEHTVRSGDRSYTDPTGCQFSLRELMKLQEDFAEEITLLQFHGQQMGVIIDRTPKCHPEIAGEGIEYAWGISKLIYRRAPMIKKRNKEKFVELVRECTNPVSSLSIERICSCSKKARSYMIMYSIIKSVTEKENVKIESH